MNYSNHKQNGIYVTVGFAFFIYIAYSVLYSFTDAEQVKSITQIAAKECHEYGIKSVSVDGFICQSGNKT